MTEHNNYNHNNINHNSLLSDEGNRILRRPGELRRELEILSERRAECLSLCGQASARYGNTRIVNGARSRGETQLLNLADLDMKIKQCRVKLSEAEKNLDTLLKIIRHTADRNALRDAAILTFYYQRGLSWTEILKYFRQSGYAVTERSLRNWRRAAVRRANMICQDRKNIKK